MKTNQEDHPSHPEDHPETHTLYYKHLKQQIPHIDAWSSHHTSHKRTTHIIRYTTYQTTNLRAVIKPDQIQIVTTHPTPPYHIAKIHYTSTYHNPNLTQEITTIIQHLKQQGTNETANPHIED